jgi:hypothetical protein
MSTTQDVQAAFDTLADHAPSEIDLATLTSGPRRHQIWLPLTAAGAVAVAAGAAVAVPAMVGHHGKAVSPAHRPTTSAQHSTPHSTPPPANVQPGTAIDMQFSFAVRPIAGYTVVPGSSNAKVQTAWATKSHYSAEIAYFTVGAYDRTCTAANGTPIQVGTQSGFFCQTGKKGKYTDVVAWLDPRSNSWIAVSALEPPGGAGKDPQTELLRIAGAVQPGPALMRLPFRLSYLPVGLQANEVNLTIEPHHATAMLGLATGTRPQPGSDGNVVTIVAEANPSADFLSGCSPATTIAGHPGCADNHQASMLTDTFGVSIESTPGTYGKAELVKILSHLTLAPADPASWFDARTTLPH